MDGKQPSGNIVGLKEKEALDYQRQKEPYKKYRLMTYTKNYIVVIFNNHIDDKDFATAEARNIYFSENKTKFIEKEIIFLEAELLDESFVEILDIISKYNDDSMIGLDEDDVIYSNDIKQQSHTAIKELCTNNRCSSKTLQLMDLLDLAVKNDKNVYFLF